MTRQRWLIAGVAAILFAGPGCVCCGNKGHALALNAGPDCEVTACQRNQVYVFAVGGLNPIDWPALDTFREKLNAQGFAKVATGNLAYAFWMDWEVRRIRAAEPDATFVFVGIDSGGPVATLLASRARRAGVPVGGVVLIDADGKTPAPTTGVRTLTIGGGYGSAVSSTVESVVVPTSGRYGLPADPRTIEAVARLLTEVALATAPPIQIDSGWTFPDAPPARPIVEPGPQVEWAFLFDQSAGVPAPIATTPAVLDRPVPVPTGTVSRNP